MSQIVNQQGSLGAGPNTTSGSASAASEDEADALRSEIERTRGQILDSIEDLHTQWSELTNWRNVIARRPLGFLLLAAGVGGALAIWIPRRKPVVRNRWQQVFSRSEP